MFLSLRGRKPKLKSWLKSFPKAKSTKYVWFNLITFYTVFILLQLLRKLERGKGEDMRHQLDQEFASLRSLLAVTSELALSEDERPSQNDYDQHVRELAFDRRAKAKDRTKTEEEKALEEKEALEKAERRRLRRMRGEEDDSSSEEEGKGRHKKRRRKDKRKAGGDDLEEAFAEEEEEEWAGLGPGLAGRPESDGSTESGEEEEEEGTHGDDHDEDDGGDTSSILSRLSGTGGKAVSQSDHQDELPFTFPCPSTHQELMDILDGVAEEDVSKVIERIRAMHHPSLHPDNKTKLQVSKRSTSTKNTL
jgi:nucleolar protein 14